MDNLNFPDRRLTSAEDSNIRRRASDWSSSYEWVVQQLRLGLATAADSAGEISALNKDIKELTNKNYTLSKEIEVLKISCEKDTELLKEDLSASKLDLSKFKDKFSFVRVFPIFLSSILFSVAVVEVVIKVFKYLNALHIVP